MSGLWPLLARAAVPVRPVWEHDEEPELTNVQMATMLATVLGLLVAHLLIAVLGCIWASRAGRGSPVAFGGWVMVAALEVGSVAVAVAGLLLWDDSHALLAVAAAPLLAQAVLSLRARDRSR